MGDITSPELVRPLAGMLVNQPDALAQLITVMQTWFGQVIKATPLFRFDYTTYYQAEMGGNLFRQYVVFEKLLPAENLADWKIASNQLEQDAGLNSEQGRLVNIDPGYLAPGKLVLASTKDHGHRIYLRKGIYAEITMKVEKKKFVTWPWTYPDYADQTSFFNEAYQDYLRAIKP